MQFQKGFEQESNDLMAEVSAAKNIKELLRVLDANYFKQQFPHKFALNSKIFGGEDQWMAIQESACKEVDRMGFDKAKKQIVAALKIEKASMELLQTLGN